MKLLPLALVSATILLAPLAAQADCRIGRVEVPVSMQGLRPTVDVKVAGQPVRLLLDSGAFFSHLDPDVVRRLKLRPVAETPTGSHLPSAVSGATSGAGGRTVAAGLVTAPSFEFAGVSFKGVVFVTGATVGGGVDGLLGQNVLRLADAEYDLKNGMLRLVTPTGCEASPLAYWAPAGTAYSMIPLDKASRYNPHTMATIEINGLPMRAMFDTGAGASFITAAAARRAGVKTSDPGVTPAGFARAMDTPAIRTWVARFDRIKIGEEEIKNLRLSIGDTDADDFDVLIGADFFLTHHVYVANSQGRLYFTYEGGKVFRAAETAD